jgi:hypothetical protein
MIFPLPFYGGISAPRCPHCGEVLPPLKIWKVVVVVGIFLAAIFIWCATWTLMDWIDPYQYRNNRLPDPTLVQVIRDQFQWLWGLLHRIW